MRRRWNLLTLEDRCNPAGTVTGTFSGTTWTITGDADANNITINPTGTPGEFVLTGTTTTVAGVTAPTGVKNIVINFLAGDDILNVNDTANPATLAGNFTIKGGDGANLVGLGDLFVTGNLSVTNGANTLGVDSLNLIDFGIGGKLLVNNGTGDSELYIDASVGKVNYIGKGVTITNGVGRDTQEFTDTHIGGNVLIKNGAPNGTNDAGYLWFFNDNLPTTAILRGNLTVGYQGGLLTTNGGFGVWDTEVLGNTTINMGSGGGEFYFDGFNTTTPTRISGNLTIKTQAATSVFISKQGNADVGLIVDKNFTLTTGNGSDSLDAASWRVLGTTKINLGGGADTVTIDDSIFNNFQLLTGAGGDTVSIDTDLFTGTTQFLKPTKIDLGADDDTLVLGVVASNSQRVELFGATTFLGGSGTDTITQDHVALMLPLVLTVLA